MATGRNWQQKNFFDAGGVGACTTPVDWDTIGEDAELMDLEQGWFEEKTANIPEEEKAKHRKRVEEAILKRVEEACLNKEEKDQLRQVLLEEKDAFALEHRFCKMSKLTPITAELVEGHPPIDSKARLIGPEKMEYLQGKIEDLVRMQMLIPEMNPMYGSPCFVVPKKSMNGQKRYRMVVDMRLLNKYTATFF